MIKDNVNDYLEKIETDDVIKDYLSVEELFTLAETPCEIPILKRFPFLLPDQSETKRHLSTTLGRYCRLLSRW